MSVPRPRHPSTWAAIGVYVVLGLAVVLEKAGLTTNDTKTPLIESPGPFLQGALGLWNPQLSLGELQNQAYGYLFPQGPFYLLAELVHLPPWVSERLWSVLLLVAGCEGARRVALAVGLSPWGAWAAAMAYGLTPRTIAQLGVRTGEILPGAALPWVLLPVVLALTGRMTVRTAALLSAAAFMFAGAVNATATAAILPLVVIVIVWGIRHGLATRGLLGWWSLAIALTSVWWGVALMLLRVYSPPFFDFVEDASDTTRTSGWTGALRGSSNWVNYVFTGGYPSWPAGYEFAYGPWLVAASGVLAAVGVLGLVTMDSSWRRPLVVSACTGLVCLTVGHAAAFGSPLAGPVQAQFDGLFALLRNIAKIDPILRLPLALGTGVVFARLVDRVERTAALERIRAQSWAPRVGVALVAALTVSMAQPALALNLRTPGWKEVPDYWHRTAEYLQQEDDGGRAWVIPGSGFGVQTWGWTMDEPMSAVATTPWVTRSQVPLVPPETIRVLSRLEEFLASGAGSPNLGATLARLGISHIVVRHDLDPTLAESTSISLVSIAMARSEGVTRETAFGVIDLGPAIEVYSVDEDPAPSITVSPVEDAVTVAGASADVVDAVARGLVSPGQAAVVQGDDGWSAPADVVGDAYRLRERNFGRVHDAEGAVLSPDEPRNSTRRVGNYPGNPGSSPVVARYDGIAYVEASSSLGYTEGLGEVRPENVPYAAVDDDPDSGWRSGYLQDPVGQWLEVHLDEPRDVGRVRITSPVSDALLGEVRRWRVEAGGTARRVAVDPLTGVAEADLSGVQSDRLRITVEAADPEQGRAPVSVLDLSFGTGDPADRTFVVPTADAADDVAYVFTARPEVRACITTLLAPDCSLGRGRLSDESLAIDRSLETTDDHEFRLSGTVIARARPGTQRLLDPTGAPAVVRGSSVLASDPTVSARMAYDGSGATSWIADPYDPSPTLSVEFDEPTTVSRIGVGQPAQPAVTPTEAVLRSGDEERVVRLGDFGVFEPIRARSLTIELRNPTRGLSPIGVGELYLGPTAITTALDGGGSTGAICGFGPVVEVDGRRYDTQVGGFLGNVVSAGPLDLSLCRPDGGRPVIPLEAGPHRVRIESTDQFQPVAVQLESTTRAPTSTRAGAAGPTSGPSGSVDDDRDLVVREEESSRQVVEIGPGAESLLRTTRNHNPGWVAELDGRELPVQRVDGWAQGWRVPAGEGGEVVIRYGPERSYIVSLVGGLAAALLVLLAAAVVLVRTRLRPGRQPEVARRWLRRPRSARDWLRVTVASALTWVLGGVPALAGLGLGAVLAVLQRRRFALWVAGTLLVAGPLLVALSIGSGGAVDPPLADLLTGTGFALAVVGSSIRPRTSPPEGATR